MTNYMKEHEIYILKMLQSEEDLLAIVTYHDRQIIWLQHERLVHLLVLIITVFALMISLIGLVILPQLGTILLFLLLLALTIPYVVHYYRLENTVQRWYKISNTLHKRIDDIGINTLNN